MNTKALLLLWFAGTTSFFIILANIFISLIPRKEERIIVYEPSSFIFWLETGLMIIILAISVWILYNYVSGKGRLELVKR